MDLSLSQPARAVWIEITVKLWDCIQALSQPARAVWIEISHRMRKDRRIRVTACEGCVD